MGKNDKITRSLTNKRGLYVYICWLKEEPTILCTLLNSYQQQQSATTRFVRLYKRVYQFLFLFYLKLMSFMFSAYIHFFLLLSSLITQY